MTDLAGRILKAWLAEGRDVRMPLDNLADTAASVAREEIMKLRIALERIAELGENGMEPDYKSWLTSHDAIAKIANEALSD